MIFALPAIMVSIILVWSTPAWLFSQPLVLIIISVFAFLAVIIGRINAQLRRRSEVALLDGRPSKDLSAWLHWLDSFRRSLNIQIH